MLNRYISTLQILENLLTPNHLVIIKLPLQIYLQSLVDFSRATQQKSSFLSQMHYRRVREKKVQNRNVSSTLGVK